MANDIVPAGSVICTEIAAGAGVDVNSRNKVEYDLVFTENLGDLKPIEINANLDGTRPSVYAIGHQGADNKVKFDVDVKVLANAEGISGENIDYFPTMCDGVTFQAEAGKKGGASEVGGVGVPTAGSLTAAEEKLLKACLGDADGDASNNLEVYNWDYGTANTTFHPHIVKIVTTPGLTARSMPMAILSPTTTTPASTIWRTTARGQGERARAVHVRRPAAHGADLSIFHDRRHGHAPGQRLDAGRRRRRPRSTDHEPRNQASSRRASTSTTTVYTSTDVSCDTTGTSPGAKKNHLNACFLQGRQGLPLRRARRTGLDEGVARIRQFLHRRTRATLHGGEGRHVRAFRPRRRRRKTASTSSSTRPSTGTAPPLWRALGLGGRPDGLDEGPISQGQFDGMAAPGDQAIGTVPIVKFEPGPTSREFVQRGPRPLQRRRRPLRALATRSTTATAVRACRLPGAPLPALRRTLLPGHDAKRTRIHLLFLCLLPARGPGRAVSRAGQPSVPHRSAPPSCKLVAQPQPALPRRGVPTTGNIPTSSIRLGKLAEGGAFVHPLIRGGPGGGRGAAPAPAMQVHGSPQASARRGSRARRAAAFVPGEGLSDRPSASHLNLCGHQPVRHLFSATTRPWLRRAVRNCIATPSSELLRWRGGRRDLQRPGTFEPHV